MTIQEKYLFDLQGFLEVPDALETGQLEAMNSVLDEKISDSMDPGATTHRFGFTLLDWGHAYRQLVDNPRIFPYLEQIVGPGFRLDHDYADVIRQGDGPIGTTLHGGAIPFDPLYSYNCTNEEIRCGLTVVAYILKDVGPDDGGFGCVPGSHKSNFRFPDEWRDLKTIRPFIRSVTGQAGTAVIFTEALTHGTLPWHGDERRTIFFKYSPNSVSWYARYYNSEWYNDLTDRQKLILEPPNARYGEHNQRRKDNSLG